MTKERFNQDAVQSFLYGASLACAPSWGNTRTRGFLQRSDSEAVLSDICDAVIGLTNSLSGFMKEDGKIPQT